MAKRQRDGKWAEPAELRRIREAFTETKACAGFEKIFGRPPHSEEELNVWVEFYTLEVYNNGGDEA